MLDKVFYKMFMLKNKVHNLRASILTHFHKVTISTDEQIDGILNRGVVWRTGMTKEEEDRKIKEYPNEYKKRHL